MNHTATPHPHTTTGRRRVPAVIALAMTAGLALSACSADPADDPATSPAGVSSSSSSSSTSSPTSTPRVTADPVSAPATSTSVPAPAPAPALPANVVGTGGPCHVVGEVAQAEDGSPLFCTDDPTAGPLWLPAGGADAGTGQARPGGPCSQQGIAVAGPGDTVLTCTLVGGGDNPGGLYWQ